MFIVTFPESLNHHILSKTIFINFSFHQDSTRLSARVDRLKALFGHDDNDDNEDKKEGDEFEEKLKKFLEEGERN